MKIFNPSVRHCCCPILTKLNCVEKYIVLAKIYTTQFDENF